MTLSLNINFDKNSKTRIIENHLLQVPVKLVLDDINGNRVLSNIIVEFDTEEFAKDKIEAVVQNGNPVLCYGYIYSRDFDCIYKISKITDMDKSKTKDIDQMYAKLDILKEDTEKESLLEVSLRADEKSVIAYADTNFLNNGEYSSRNEMKDYINGNKDKSVSVQYKLISVAGKAMVYIIKIEDKATPENVIKTKTPKSAKELESEIAQKNAIIADLQSRLSTSNSEQANSKVTNDDILALVNDQNRTMNAMVDVLSNFLQKFGSIAPVLEDLQASNEQAKQREKMKDLDAIEQKYLNLSPKAILNDKVDRLAKREKDNSVPYQSIVDDVISRRKTIFNSDKDDNKVVKKNKRIMIERNDVE